MIIFSSITCQTFLSSLVTLYLKTALSLYAQIVPFIGSFVMLTNFPYVCIIT